MPKIAVIGAGSMVFAKNLIGDILSFPALDDSTFALMDVDEERLDRTTEAAEILASKSDGDATVHSTLDRREALRGADYVLDMINVGGIEPFENEIRIPEKYGVNQAIGDTLGPGGVFRGLRTIPVMLDVVSDMEELCPDALHVNYSNPMAINCWALNEASDVETVGLCHSVPHNVADIAEYIGAPVEELDYVAAGINHMAWFIECEWNGRDVTPMLEEAMADPETYRRDTVRFEVLEYFGRFLTESSHHLSEYVPYYRSDRETIDEYTGTYRSGRMETGYYLEQWRAERNRRDEATSAEAESAAAIDDPEGEMKERGDDLEIERSSDYTSRLVHSIETGTERRLHVNLPNEGAIDNLDPKACVEVPAAVDGTGVHQIQVGRLPPQLAALVRTNVNVQELAVKAALEHDRDAVHQALMVDPLTASSCTPDEIYEMTQELIEANAEYLPQFS